MDAENIIPDSDLNQSQPVSRLQTALILIDMAVRIISANSNEWADADSLVNGLSLAHSLISDHLTLTGGEGSSDE